MPTALIKQQRLGELVEQRAKARHALRKLEKLAHELLIELQSGAKVEPGIFRVEVHQERSGAGILSQLLVDGRPADDIR